LKYKLKGKNRFSGFTGLESDGFSVLILSKTAQAYWVDIIDLAKILIYSGMI
jgi:hypothetical protein